LLLEEWNMDINENEEQIKEEMDQLLPDSADLAAPDVDEPVEVEQAEQAELAMEEAEESAAVEADEPVETELGEHVATEMEELGEIEAEEVIDAEAEIEEPVAAETEELAAVEADEPVEVELGEPVATETEELGEIEVEEVVDAEAEIDETKMDEPVDSQEDKFAIYKQEEAIQDESEISAKYSVLAEPDKEDGRAWYVVHCYSGNEDKVRHNIMQRIESMGMDDLIFDVVVPTEDEVNIKNGERQTVEKKVFPGYILVNMALTEESWYMVRNTPGVTGFVGMGNDPTALQPEEVARILKRMESESPRVNVTFRQGERVRIVDGPFEDFYGKVAEIDMDRATVRVMVNFFGRETPVELDFLQVEEA
jgi:transcriptional antiterminator NusG